MNDTSEKLECEWCGEANDNVIILHHGVVMPLCATHRSMWNDQYKHECRARRCKCGSTDEVVKVTGKFIWRCRICREKEIKEIAKEKKLKKWGPLEEKFDKKITELTAWLEYDMYSCADCGKEQDIEFIKTKDGIKPLCLDCRNNIRTCACGAVQNLRRHGDVYLCRNCEGKQAKQRRIKQGRARNIESLFKLLWLSSFEAKADSCDQKNKAERRISKKRSCLRCGSEKNLHKVRQQKKYYCNDCVEKFGISLLPKTGREKAWERRRKNHQINTS